MHQALSVPVCESEGARTTGVSGSFQFYSKQNCPEAEPKDIISHKATDLTAAKCKMPMLLVPTAKHVFDLFSGVMIQRGKMFGFL